MFSSQKSRASSYVGTHIYMSPEMIHSTICDEKGDLWAYACIFYEFFVGDYLHIEFDSPERFEEQLAHRCAALAQVLPPPPSASTGPRSHSSRPSRSTTRATGWTSRTCPTTPSSTKSAPPPPSRPAG